MDTPRSEQMHIDVRTMRYFIALADEGTMRRAANVLKLTQPTLSRQIGALEQSVGKQLYVRKGGRVHLTQEGRLLYGYAQQIVGLADRAANELTAERSTVAGRVALCCAETGMLELICDCIASLRRKHPGVTVDVTIGSPLESFQRLDAGIIDFLLDIDGVPRPGFDRLSLPGGNEWAFVMPADDPLAACDAVRPADLAGKPVVCSRLVLKSGILEAWAGPEVFPTLEVGATFNLGTYLITTMAAHGLGYVLTYGSLQQIVGDPRVATRPLDPAIPADRNVLLWKRHRSLSPACLAFLDELRSMVEG